MKTDLIQTVIATLDDDHGVNHLAYLNLKQLVNDQVGPKAANRLGNIVDATDGRFYIDVSKLGTPLDVYEYINPL